MKEKAKPILTKQAALQDFGPREHEQYSRLEKAVEALQAITVTIKLMSMDGQVLYMTQRFLTRNDMLPTYIRGIVKCTSALRDLLLALTEAKKEVDKIGRDMQAYYVQEEIEQAARRFID